MKRLEWDKDYRFDVTFHGTVIHSLTVNPRQDCCYSKEQWELLSYHSQQYMVEAIAQKIFKDGLAIVPAVPGDAIERLGQAVDKVWEQIELGA